MFAQFSTVANADFVRPDQNGENALMKPLAIAIGKRILLLAGDPKQLEDVEIEKNPNGNLVLVKKDLDT